MRIRTLTTAILICCSVGVLYAQDNLTNPDAQAVRSANSGFYAALNAMFAGDLTPMQSVWSHADDVTYLGPDGSFRVGWEATLKDWQKQAAMKLGGKVEPSEIHINVGRELAVVHNYEVGENVVDGNPTTVKIRATNVYRKENGQWNMIGHHTDRLRFLDQ